MQSPGLTWIPLLLKHVIETIGEIQMGFKD